MDKIFAKGIVTKGENGELTVVVSTEGVDRSGESIPLTSWDLKNFQKSPRMFVDHDYSVRSIVGIWKNARIEDGALKMTPVFHELTDLARETKGMVDGGFLDTTSVGFMRKRAGKANAAGDTNELLEVSWVGVPCNPDARIERQLSIKDIDGDTAENIEKFCKENSPEVTEEAAPVEEPAAEPVVEAPPVEEPKKGVIDDTLAAAQELANQKYAYLDPMWDTFCRFCQAYMTASVPAEAISSMVDDLVTQLQAIVTTPPAENGEEDDMMEMMALTLERRGYVLTKKTAQKETVEIEEKAGRVLSNKNRGIIQASLDAMSEATAALTDLLNASEGSAQGDDAPEKSTDQEQSDDQKEMDAIAMRKRVIKVVATQLGEALNKLKMPRN